MRHRWWSSAVAKIAPLPSPSVQDTISAWQEFEARRQLFQQVFPRPANIFHDRAFDPAATSSPPALIAGPILAWRVWKLVKINGSARLQSLNQDTIYPPRQPMNGAGVAPDTGISPARGVYACKTREMAVKLSGISSTPNLRTISFQNNPNAVFPTQQSSNVVAWGPAGMVYEMRALSPTSAPLSHATHVLGQIALWGRVIEHEHGYRAEWGYPWCVEVSKEAEPMPSPMPGFPWTPPESSLADQLRETYGCKVVEV